MTRSSLTLTQGIDSGYAWPMVDGDGGAATLTGYSVLAQVRATESPTGTKLADLTAAIDGSSVTVTWTAEESLAWTWTYGWADVVLIDADSRPVQIVWQGTVGIDLVVSHA